MNAAITGLLNASGTKSSSGVSPSLTTKSTSSPVSRSIRETL